MNAGVTTTDTDTTTDTATATAKTTAITTPHVSVATVTAGGTVSLQTVTVMPTATSASSSADQSGDGSAKSTSQSHGLSAGAAAGVAVGVLGAVVIVGVAGVLLWLRRRRQQREQLTTHNRSPRGSSAGMSATPTTAMGSVWGDGEGLSMGRRSSRLMPHDPRMDPYSSNIYGRFENKSHESVNTLEDGHDYSRKVLRTTNPDPPDA
ncbi:hypothetical protein GGR56DRAFT_67217 [Xylariaceae sp. FL0804]|nr:hypothetical protein GGR56DRAFT_67217 [Xylariaceae sp. FL0804]